MKKSAKKIVSSSKEATTSPPPENHDPIRRKLDESGLQGHERARLHDQLLKEYHRKRRTSHVPKSYKPEHCRFGDDECWIGRDPLERISEQYQGTINFVKIGKQIFVQISEEYENRALADLLTKRKVTTKGNDIDEENGLFDLYSLLYMIKFGGRNVKDYDATAEWSRLKDLIVRGDVLVLENLSKAFRVLGAVDDLFKRQCNEPEDVKASRRSNRSHFLEALHECVKKLGRVPYIGEVKKQMDSNRGIEIDMSDLDDIASESGYKWLPSRGARAPGPVTRR